MKPHPPGFPTLAGLVELEVCEERRSFPLEDAEAGRSHAANLQLRPFAQAELQHGAPGPDIRADHDLHLGSIWQNASRRLPGHFPTVDLVLYPIVASHQPIHRLDVGRLSLLDLPGPGLFQWRVAHYGRGHDERGV